MLTREVSSIFKARRDRLMKAHPGAVFLFPSLPTYLRNEDVHYPFRQESSFFYLTGLEEAETFLMLVPDQAKSAGYKMVLFIQGRDPEKEMWEGERYGTEGAQSVFGADEAYPIGDFEKKLPELARGAERFFYHLGADAHRDRLVLELLEKTKRSQGRSGKSLPPIEDPALPLGEMRLFKDAEEVAHLRKACQISAASHVEAMKQVKPGHNEGFVEALVDFHFRSGGCQRYGYPSIVAGGKNAACLHYRANNDTLKEGDLLLIDAGGEYNYYTADITRTFPVGKKFSSVQADVYGLVLKAQMAAIDMVKPGVTLPALHRRVCEVLIEGYLSRGLLKGNVADILSSGQHRKYYPHNTSHWLGMDVHDAGLYQKNGEPRPLEKGMVFTIEPGFYVQPGDRETPLQYQNIGIRIEDDILVTDSGCEVLTAGVPKSIDEIEKLRNA